MNNTLSILTYNIHKGFSAANRKFILNDIKKSIQVADADLVCLQEVIGSNVKHDKKVKDWPSSSQFEYLADQTWEHFAYGKNAVYTKGDHGNAVLSKFPIVTWANHDISSIFERRGLLHVVLNMNNKTNVHVFCVHLGLFEKDRRKQLNRLIEHILESVPSHSPLIVAGDFNDWKNYANQHLLTKLNMKEAFHSIHGKLATTFPSKLPILPLDRIYYRNLKCSSAHLLKDRLWSRLSDHLPLVAKFELLPEVNLDIASEIQI